MTDLLLSPSLAFASWVYAFNTSEMASGKSLVVLLVLCSMVGWTIIISKSRELKRLRRESDRLQQAFGRSKQILGLYSHLTQMPDSPLREIYAHACRTIGEEIEAHGGIDRFVTAEHEHIRMNATQLNAVRNAAERQAADQVVRLEKNMDWLAIIVSISPMIGLLGTVWGVMDSFVEMAKIGMVNLQAVAPGIAGALLTTVIGLMIAIPSVGAYNLLGSNIRRQMVQMDNFVDAFMSEAHRAFQRE